jgi:nucleotide-binding universal stress UspA family protein
MRSAPSVLCAVDLSGHSRKVMQHACAIAEHFRARLIGVTIAPTKECLAAIESDLRSFMGTVLPVNVGLQAEFQARLMGGSPAATILRIAHEEAVDLVIVGTHGASGFRRNEFGSTTEGILRHADIPVLVVPGDGSDLHSLDDRREIRDIGSVMAPIDFGPLSERDARIASGIADTLGVPLVLVHVCAPVGGVADGGGYSSLEPDIALTRLRAIRADLPGRSRTETWVARGYPADEIAALAADRDVGLIVMGLRGAGSGIGPRPGSIAYRTLCLTPTMLLALPASLRRAMPRAQLMTA